MNARNLAAVAIVVLGAILMSSSLFAQTQVPASGPAEGGSPAWFLQRSFPDPTGNTVVDADGHVTVLPRTAPGALLPPASNGSPRTPACAGSPICGNRITPGRQALQRVQWEQALGYTFSYPYVLPPGPGG